VFTLEHLLSTTVCWTLQVILNCSDTKRGGVSNRKQLAMKVKRTDLTLALFPGLHAQLLSLAVRKVGGRPGRIYHVMCAAADIT